MIGKASSAARTTTAIAFMVAVGESYNVMSALNSSPWSAENFTADDQMVESLMRYIRWTAVVCLTMGAVASYIDGSVYPFAGAAAVTVLAWWMYDRAAKKGLERNAGHADDPGF